eukprot:14773927-Alexandrium_andersonii.AAC.1
MSQLEAVLRRLGLVLAIFAAFGRCLKAPSSIERHLAAPNSALNRLKLPETCWNCTTWVQDGLGGVAPFWVSGRGV